MPKELYILEADVTDLLHKNAIEPAQRIKRNVVYYGALFSG